MQKFSTQPQNATAKTRLGVRVITWLSFVLIAVILFVGYRISRAQYDMIVERAEAISQLRDSVQQSEREVASLEELLAQYDRITRNDIARLEAIVPTGEDIPSLYVQFQSIAEQHGFLVNSITINPSNGTSENNLHSLSVNLTMLGPDYEEFKRFLGTIEYNLRLFDVNSVFFNPATNSYSLSLTTYYYAE